MRAESRSNRDRSNRLISLDGLRGVAALAVAASHFETISGLKIGVHGAGRAVDFFFVLSGFVIARAYEKRLAAGLSFGAYARLRLERLYPSILAGLLVGLVAALWAGQAELGMALAFLLLPVLSGAAEGEAFPLNGPQWSLTWELAVNALHAAVLRRFNLIGLLALCVAAAFWLWQAAASPAGLDLGWSRGNFWLGAPRILFGFGAGLVLARLHLRLGRFPHLPWVLTALLLTLLLFEPWAPWTDKRLADWLAVAVASPVLVLVSVDAAPPRPLTNVAVWLGAISYPLYALHAPMLRLAEKGLEDLEGPAATGAWIGMGLAVLILTTLFERWGDRPIRAWLAGRRRG